MVYSIHIGSDPELTSLQTQMTFQARNEDLLPLVKLAYEAFSSGDTVKASAFRAKINIRLEKRGESPMEFWTNFQKAAELYANA